MLKRNLKVFDQLSFRKRLTYHSTRLGFGTLNIEFTGCQGFKGPFPPPFFISVTNVIGILTKKIKISTLFTKTLSKQNCTTQ